MSIQLNNRVRDLEFNVEQLKEMLAAVYMQLKELTKQVSQSNQPQAKVNRR